MEVVQVANPWRQRTAQVAPGRLHHGGEEDGAHVTHSAKSWVIGRTPAASRHNLWGQLDSTAVGGKVMTDGEAASSLFGAGGGSVTLSTWGGEGDTAVRGKATLDGEAISSPFGVGGSSVTSSILGGEGGFGGGISSTLGEEERECPPSLRGEGERGGDAAHGGGAPGTLGWAAGGAAALRIPALAAVPTPSGEVLIELGLRALCAAAS